VALASRTSRLVLDTNACLDLFVFADPRCALLRGALERGSVVALTDADCRAEWLRVLRYPRLALDAAQQADAVAAFDALVRDASASDCATSANARLPRCADADDQKFLELALRAGAGAVLTRDDALLALGRRLERAGLFAILTPLAWCERHAEAH